MVGPSSWAVDQAVVAGLRGETIALACDMDVSRRAAFNLSSSWEIWELGFRVAIRPDSLTPVRLSLLQIVVRLRGSSTGRPATAVVGWESCQSDRIAV